MNPSTEAELASKTLQLVPGADDASWEVQRDGELVGGIVASDRRGGRVFRVTAINGRARFRLSTDATDLDECLLLLHRFWRNPGQWLTRHPTAIASAFTNRI